MPVDFKQIARLRKEQKMSMKEAAERAGYTGNRPYVWWSDIERGISKKGEPLDLRVSTLESVARGLGCRVQDLLTKG